MWDQLGKALMRDTNLLQICSMHFKGFKKTTTKQAMLTYRNRACWFCRSWDIFFLRVGVYCLPDLQMLSQLWFTWLCWHESRGEVSCYRFPCPITQGLKSVWTCPFQHLSAPQRLLPAFKRTTLPSSLTLQGTCGRMQQSALWSSVWICIKFLRMHAFYNESKAFQAFQVQKFHGRRVKFYSVVQYISVRGI